MKNYPLFCLLKSKTDDQKRKNKKCPNGYGGIKMKSLEKNKKKWLLGAFILVLIGAAFRAGTVFGAGAEPGSSGDPLITQSYLEEQLKDFSSGSFHKIKVPKGRTLTASSGTQVILYSGNATVSSAGGILNLTKGTAVSAGETVVKYQSYLIPEKGRGITCSSECILFIQGDYE